MKEEYNIKNLNPKKNPHSGNLQKPMAIKQIRAISGLSQVKFGQKYGIPRRTIEGWECDENSPNHRVCPDYVRRLLERVVKEDFLQKQS